MKKLCILLFLTALSVLTLLPASAHTTQVYDPAELLAEQQEAALATACDCTDPYGISCYIVVWGNALTALSERAVLSACGIDEDSDAVILVVRTSGTYYYDLYTFGKAHSLLSDADVDRLLDDPAVYGNLKGGRLSEGCTAFTQLLGRMMCEKHQAELEREKRAPLMALLCGGVIMLITGGITALCIVLSYRKKRHGESYPLDRYATLSLTEREDIFVGSYVTRVRVQSSSSGGRPGGSSGGHRGGR